MTDFDEINRRQMLKRITLMTGGALSASVIGAVLSAAIAQEIKRQVFSKKQLTLVGEMAQMIIPDTDTPGAKAAGVDDYIHLIVADWYNADERENFMTGLKSVDDKFLNGSLEERTTILTKLDHQVRNIDGNKTFFEEFKELTLVGYFTSQIGAEQELRYEQYPGPYEGCVPFVKVGRTWAT